MNYQSAKFQCCRLSLASFIEKLRKHIDMKLNIGYHPAKFQISWLSGSNFMEVNVRLPKHHYDVIMTSFIINEIPNWHIL